MRKLRVLDLFCGGGGSAMGYHLAGFEVVGVDLVHQPHYPFEFHRADAMTFPLDGFDLYHASPVCKAYTYCPVEVGHQAMGITWMSRAEMAQAIPPAYTRWVGEQLMRALIVEEVAS